MHDDITLTHRPVTAPRTAAAVRHSGPHDADRQRARASHPAARTSRTGPSPSSDTRAERGSIVTEYGLLAIVGATIASLVVKWATGGAIWQLFDAVTDKVRVLLGA